MPPLRPLTPLVRPHLHILSIRSSSKNATPPNTVNEHANETNRDEHPTKSSPSGAASKTIGALIESSSGMDWEKLWLKNEKDYETAKETKGVEGEQMEQKESNKAQGNRDPYNQGQTTETVAERKCRRRRQK